LVHHIYCSVAVVCRVAKRRVVVNNVPRAEQSNVNSTESICIDCVSVGGVIFGAEELEAVGSVPSQIVVDEAVVVATVH
jgi:hypothetical protein